MPERDAILARKAAEILYILSLVRDFPNSPHRSMIPLCIRDSEMAR